MARKDAVLAAVLAISTGALVFATRTAQQSGDSLSYAYAVREGEGLVHPHHLAFLPLLRAFYVSAGGPGADPSSTVLAVAQAHGAFWAGAGAAAAFLAFSGLGFSRVGAGIGACALVFSQGIWVLATHASPYVPAAACLAVAFALLVRGGDGMPTARRLVSVSLAWVAAVLFHQANVLFAVPLLLGLTALSPRRAPRLALAATVPAGAIVLSVYVATFLFTVGDRSVERFIRFVTRYAHAGKPQWGDTGNVGIEGVGLVFRNQLWNLLAIPRGATGAMTVLFGVAIVTLVGWHVVRIVRGDRVRPIRLLLVAWLLSYWALFLWWVPSETKLYCLTVFPLVLLGGLAVRDLIRSAIPDGRGRRFARIAAATVVAGVGAFHLLVIVLPTHARPKPAFLEAKRLADAVPGECAALADYEVAQSLRFYFGWRRSAPASASLIQAYQGRKLEVVLVVRDVPCVVVDFDAILPTRSTFGFDGDREPRRWLEHLEWLLDVERDTGGQVIGCRRIDVFNTTPRRAYLRIGAERVRVDGLQALCASLDALAERAGAPAGQFLAWYRRNGASLP